MVSFTFFISSLSIWSQWIFIIKILEMEVEYPLIQLSHFFLKRENPGRDSSLGKVYN
jgi:hypothetical protein